MIHDTFREYYDNVVEMRQKLGFGTDATLLKFLCDVWIDFQSEQRLVGSVFLYLDRSYCKTHMVPGVRELVLKSFRESIWNEKTLREPVKSALLQQIQASHFDF